jgi:hypothetical protein
MGSPLSTLHSRIVPWPSTKRAFTRHSLHAVATVKTVQQRAAVHEYAVHPRLR